MAVDDRISFYGIGIESNQQEKVIDFYGIGIESNQREKVIDLYGIGIEALNVFNAKLYVRDENGDAVSGATVAVNSTQTIPSNFAGNFTITTDSDGMVNITGSSTVGTTLTITKTGYTTYSTPLPTYTEYASVILQISPSGGGESTSKKIYTTNKGNVLINPNDTVLIELD